MIKMLILVLAFVISSTVLLLSNISFLSASGKIILIALEAIAFQIYMMDKSFLKKEKRAELRKVIDDYTR